VLLEPDEPEAADGRLAAELGAVLPRRSLYTMGIHRTHLEQAIGELGLPAVITHDEHEADAVLVLKSVYRRQADRIDALTARGLPLYILRSTGVDRLREALGDLYRPDIERARASPRPT
jgi:hypothetical protein